MEKTLEEFVQMTAMVQVNKKDFEKMYAHFGIDENQWQQIAMHWMSRIGNDAEFSTKFQAMMVEEMGRQQGAQPTV